MKAFLGETIGTFILVLIGIGSVALSVLWGWFTLWQIALIWTGGVSLAIYSSRNLSGAHLNPAVSIGLVLAGKERIGTQLGLKIIGQFVGAFAAAFAIYYLFWTDIQAVNPHYPNVPLSSGTALFFGEFYPNPGFAGLQVDTSFAFLVEGFGTLVLMLVILLLPGKKRTQPIEPILIGCTVGILIFFLAPYTQAGFNPARDFAPRVFAYLAGWKQNALANGWSGSIWVYVIAPIVGAGIASIGIRTAKRIKS